MKQVSIRELHEKTGHWVRRVSTHEQIIITDRGQAIASLHPYRQPAKANRFQTRKLLPAFAKLRGRLAAGPESTALISQDRDARP